MNKVTKQDFDAWRQENPQYKTLPVHICEPPQTHFYDSNIWGVGELLARVVHGSAEKEFFLNPKIRSGKENH